MEARGTLIDIEGADGSGKTEQAKRLYEHLKQQGDPVAYFDFPRYGGSHAGKLTGELLSGKRGDFMSVSSVLSALPYAIDRGGAKDDIQAAIDDGKIIVSNRYTPSNLAHQSAKLPPAEQPALVELIEDIEYGDLKIPRPTIVFYLAVPTDISSELIGKKEKRDYLGGEARDLAERNVAHQDRTRTAYLKLAKEKGWHVIECTRAGAMRAPEDIEREIWKIVQEHLAR